MKKTSTLLAALALAAGVQAQTAATPVIYPAKGQSAQQQDKDRYECHDWARRQSGFDPTQAQAAQATTTPSNGAGTSAGSTAGGMAAGAMGGAAVAELSHHDAGRGAAIGALGAAALNRAKQAQAHQQQQQRQQAQQQAARAQQRSVYERSFAACLEARGYSVR